MLSDKLRKFHGTDLTELNGWYAARKLPPVPEHMLPEIGFIVSGVAAGFIYQTDSSLCFLDGYITNPHSQGELRVEAFDLISENLIRVAKEHRFTSILAYTKVAKIKTLCEKHGFSLKGQYNLFVRGI